jgi:signal transduction histidine kinase
MSQPEPNVEALLQTIHALRTRVAGLEGTEADCRRAEERLRALSRRLMEVQEAERRHLARELYDEVGQQLTGLGLLLKHLQTRGPSGSDPAWSEAQAVLDDLLGRVRALGADLRPALLDQLGLRAALLDLVERFARRT